MAPRDLTDLPAQNENTVRAGAKRDIWIANEPTDASFKSARFEIVEVLNGGLTSITGEAIDEFVTIVVSGQGEVGIRASLITTDKIQAGDIIRVQARNNRDLDVVSEILSILVV